MITQIFVRNTLTCPISPKGPSDEGDNESFILRMDLSQVPLIGITLAAISVQGGWLVWRRGYGYQEANFVYFLRQVYASDMPSNNLLSGDFLLL
ncbi:hypothetical protein AVEN_166787-1 [Araneus ventricosus]|uniref:Uncharacterized protein n=1 Tax=Araneus ventricosus TaxID=182803 RepID=A0A4Y2BQ43_ARAVE|nr:hypothetical protein AVEN_166787-1 [Araneus ventricosus]